MKTYIHFVSNTTANCMRMVIVLAGLCLAAACKQPNSTVALDTFHNGQQETCQGNEITVNAGNLWTTEGDYRNFLLSGQALTTPGAEAALRFHTDGMTGYEVAFSNHQLLQMCKTIGKHI